MLITPLCRGAKLVASLSSLLGAMSGVSVLVFFLLFACFCLLLLCSFLHILFLLREEVTNK